MGKKLFLFVILVCSVVTEFSVKIGFLLCWILQYPHWEGKVLAATALCRQEKHRANRKGRSTARSTKQVTTDKLGLYPDSITCPPPVITESPAATCKKPRSLLLSHPLWCCRHRHVGKHAQGCSSQPAKEWFKHWWLLNKLIMSEVKVFNIRAGRLPKSPSKNLQLDSAGAWSLHGLSTSWVKLGLELERRVASYNPSFSKTIHLWAGELQWFISSALGKTGERMESWEQLQNHWGFISF